MKKLFLFICLIGLAIGVNAQAYKTINIEPLEHNTISSSTGISVESITVEDGNQYTVTLLNTNRNSSGSRDTYSFTWYLSYKGKRVSDYFQENIPCKKSSSRTVYVWPNTVPAGYGKYVTVQFGVQVIRDYRDDD
ncbi:MAG: hypothetical protein IJ213_07435 [Bacteroidales bacterium]|nr:hypothetical protein [Bacteroidales bacterium]